MQMDWFHCEGFATVSLLMRQYEAICDCLIWAYPRSLRLKNDVLGNLRMLQSIASPIAMTLTSCHSLVSISIMHEQRWSRRQGIRICCDPGRLSFRVRAITWTQVKSLPLLHTMRSARQFRAIRYVVRSITFLASPDLTFNLTPALTSDPWSVSFGSPCGV